MQGDTAVTMEVHVAKMGMAAVNRGKVSLTQIKVEMAYLDLIVTAARSTRWMA